MHTQNSHVALNGSLLHMSFEKLLTTREFSQHALHAAFNGYLTFSVLKITYHIQGSSDGFSSTISHKGVCTLLNRAVFSLK